MEKNQHSPDPPHITPFSPGPRGKETLKHTSSTLYHALPSPSGLSIGTTLKTKLSRSSLASSEGPVRKSITPFIIQEALVSPGWTRPEGWEVSSMILLGHTYWSYYRKKSELG